jgi:outer membrane protein OmpA-like peptidoglycan-associated protein
MKLNSPLVVMATATALLAGCTNPDGTVNRPVAGAAAGAVAGGILGKAIGGDDRSAAIGAAFGTIIGAGIGNNLDAQEAELRQSLGPDANIKNTGNELVITLPEAITFEFGSAVVRPAYRPTIESMSRTLQRYPDSTVSVVGHTDNVGSAAINQQLSEERAGAVAQVLIQSGTSAARLRISGRGFEMPIASNDTQAGRAANRRVEITIRPNS